MPAPAPPVVSRFARWAVIVVAVGVGAAALARGTWAAGGSDSSCYALMADAFAIGQLQPVSRLALGAPWPDASRTFAPAGFIPSPVRPDAASPICAPGFSVLLAPFRWAGGVNGIFLGTPIAGALTVWLVGLYTRRLAGPAAGLAGAALVATIPVFLFQVVQPMNDVTSTALWMAVLSAALTTDPTRPWLLGFFTSLGVLVRPNLAPGAVVVAAWLAVMSMRAGGISAGLFRRNLLAFVLAALPAAALLAVLNTRLYGGPFESGYGSALSLFSPVNIAPNVVQFGRTLFETQLGLPLIGLFGPFVLARAHRPVAWLAVAVSLSIVAVYLLYRPYPEWWYLRFLLPALVPLTALAVIVFARAVLFMPRGSLRVAMAGAIVLALCWHGVAVARERQAFNLHRLERRFWLTGDVARARLPANAVFVSIWESGSLRHHADRLSILWDSLDPASLDSAVAWLANQGRDPYIVVEQWEEPAFRDRFASRSPLGALDWPPRFEIDRQVRIYKPSDRAAYLRGDPVPTEYVVPR